MESQSPMTGGGHGGTQSQHPITGGGHGVAVDNTQVPQEDSTVAFSSKFLLKLTEKSIKT
jgi:hypothetical protein